jgi:hypothetical protein
MTIPKLHTFCGLQAGVLISWHRATGYASTTYGAINLPTGLMLGT